MAPFEKHAFGSGQPVDFVYEDSYGFVNSMLTLPTRLTESGSHDLLNNAAALDNGRDESSYNFSGHDPKYAESVENVRTYTDYCPPNDRFNSESARYNGPDGPGHTSDGLLAELFLEYWPPDRFTSEPWMETEQDNGYSPLSRPPQFDFVQVSDTTLTSGPTKISSPDQEENSAEDLNSSLESIISWPAPVELFPANEDHYLGSAVVSPCQGQPSIFEGVSKKEMNKKRKRKRSGESKKYTCEIRISKKILEDGIYLKKKAWLGTFATPAQKGRALDVGRYFLCTKKKKIFFSPNSEVILSAFKDHLQALPLAELVEIVTKMARHYGEKGSLLGSLNSLCMTASPQGLP